MKTKELFQAHNVKVFQDVEDKYPWQVQASRGAVLEVFKASREVKLSIPSNGTDIEDHHSNDAYAMDFNGGLTSEQFQNGYYDKNLFTEQRKKLSSLRTKLEEKLEPVARTRKRVMSEHDGEWIQERQWELTPFANTRRETGGILPTLRILADFSFRSGVDGRDIAKYGAFCWAITDALESSGITCEVILQNTSYMNWGKSGENKTRVRIKVKEAGEYIDTQNIAQCFTAAFYRRGIFVLKRLFGDSLGTKVQSSLAGSDPDSSTPIVSPGQVFLRREDASLNVDAVAHLILEALNAPGTH